MGQTNGENVRRDGQKKRGSSQITDYGRDLIEMENSRTPLQSKRHSVFRRRNTAQGKTAEGDDRAKHSREIGKTVARDYEDADVFIGEIVRDDYDSEDVDKVESI